MKTTYSRYIMPIILSLFLLPILSLEAKTETIQLELHGINCKDLANIYEDQLQNEAGIQRVKLDHRRGKSTLARFKVDSDLVDRDSVIELVDKWGMQEKKDSFSDETAVMAKPLKKKQTGEIHATVRDLMCSGSKRHIKEIYGKAPGVIDVKVKKTSRSTARGEAIISYDATKFSQEEVVKSLKQVSFLYEYE